MDAYTIKDTMTNSTVAVIDGKRMPIEEGFETIRHELADMQRQRDNAVRCVEMLIKSYKCCDLCANMRCKVKDGYSSTCKPIWNGTTVD